MNALKVFCLMLAVAILPATAEAQTGYVSYEAGPRVDSILQWAEAESPSLRTDLVKIRSNMDGFLVVATAQSAGVVLKEDVLAANAHSNPGLMMVVVDMEKADKLAITDAELTWVLVHEVYGHATHALLAGAVCSDPVDGQPYAMSCVANRESVVLAELGMAPRKQYPLR